MSYRIQLCVVNVLIQGETGAWGGIVFPALSRWTRRDTRTRRIRRPRTWSSWRGGCPTRSERLAEESGRSTSRSRRSGSGRPPCSWRRGCAPRPAAPRCPWSGPRRSAASARPGFRSGWKNRRRKMKDVNSNSRESALDLFPLMDRMCLFKVKVKKKTQLGRKTSC